MSLLEVLAIAPRRAPFTSDDPIQAYLDPDPMRGADPQALLALAIVFRAAHPRATFRDFTRWLS
ncbi:MAG TPA: hypothetical protein VGH28_10425 [Polyangiaceae bacterium]|jgi:hypothetical protein